MVVLVTLFTFRMFSEIIFADIRLLLCLNIIFGAHINKHIFTSPEIIYFHCKKTPSRVPAIPMMGVACHSIWVGCHTLRYIL